MGVTLESCDRCGAILTPWERHGCGCEGPRGTGNAEILYTIGCLTSTPLHVRDFVRLAGHDYGRIFSEPTANTTLAQDFRFCWAGRGLYCLYRHGPLPGPRSLEDTARLALFSARRPLTIDALDFCLKRLNYRYNVASLKNAINRSFRIAWRWSDGRWEHPESDITERRLRTEIPLVPRGQRGAWDSIVERLNKDIHEALADRQSRLHSLEGSAQLRIKWDISKDT